MCLMFSGALEFGALFMLPFQMNNNLNKHTKSQKLPIYERNNAIFDFIIIIICYSNTIFSYIIHNS